MKLHSMQHRLIACLLVASASLTALAPAAEAGYRRGQTYKIRRSDVVASCGRVAYAPSRVVQVHHVSDGGSTLAGFIGGLAIGAILTSAAQANASTQVVYEAPVAYSPPPAYGCESGYGYSYVDPYCHERFTSLDVYYAHAMHYCHHVQAVWVIDNRSGECVDLVSYQNGRWHSCGRD